MRVQKKKLKKKSAHIRELGADECFHFTAWETFFRFFTDFQR